jgi:hypothetical protein
MFARRPISLYLPVLVLSLFGLMAGAARAGGGCPGPHECCDSLVNIDIEFHPVFNVWLVNNQPILSYDTVDVSDFWNENDILTFSDLLNNNQIASNNANDLTLLLGELNVLSENQTVVGLINGIVYYAEGH